MERAHSILLISYNGVLEPIVQSQVLPYLRQLNRAGYRFTILSFEKRKRPRRQAVQELAAMRQRLAREGIHWYALRYHKSPSVPATLWDIWCGSWVAAWLAWRYRVEVVHARASIAGIMAILPVKLARCRFVFDIRGLNAEEYVDGSGWSRRSLRYRVLKRLEGYLMRMATENIVLTEAVRELLQEEHYVSGTRHVRTTVIPTCVDTDHFTFHAPSRPEQGSASDRISVVYLGSLGTWYLVEGMVEFVATMRRYWPAVSLCCLTQSDPAIMERAWTACGLPPHHLTTRRVGHAEVPRYLAASEVGLCFIKPSFSKQSSYPTKIGEYLACGVPVVVNASVGDCDRLVDAHRVGVVVRRLDPAGYAEACDRLFQLLKDREGLRRRCRQVAEDFLSLAVGVERYRAVYERCLGSPWRVGGLEPSAAPVADMVRQP